MASVYIFKDRATGEPLLIKSVGTDSATIRISIPGIEVCILPDTSNELAQQKERLAQVSLALDRKKVHLAKQVMAAFTNLQIQLERIAKDRSATQLDKTLITEHNLSPEAILQVRDMASSELRYFHNKAQRTLDAWSEEASRAESAAAVDNYFRGVHNDTVMGPYALANQLNEETS